MGVRRAAGLSAPANRRRFALRKCSSLRLLIVGFVLLVALVPLYLHVPEPFPSEPEEKRAEVTLLIWTHPFGKRQKLPDCSARFRIGGCALTDDEGAYPRADAVILHHREIGTGAVDAPSEPRPRAQKWIWLNYESPSHTPELTRWDGVFNMTMSYRTDSDIYLPYGYLVPVPGRSLREPSPVHLRKPRLLAWVVSNWSESQARVAFYYELSRFVSVDVFGRAGRTVPEDSGSSSLLQLLTRYQFYLSLENSLHTDYITEKLWNAVRAGAIPVVLGPSRRNYERFLPAEAFIHVDDFPTVRELARYLLMVRGNPALLMRHLSWRGRYTVHQPSFWAEHYCFACKAVKRTRGRTSVVRDLSRWFDS
ncbi:alpha-(1,3)-fucosyltransferase 4-like [Neosynchiropus ocellatus]